MLLAQIKRGMRVAMAKNDETMRDAVKRTTIPESTMYRFMAGKNDMYIRRLNGFCEDAWEMSIMDILELGK